MKLRVYIKHADAVYSAVRNGRGWIQNLVIDKHQVMDDLVPQEMAEDVPNWKDRHHMEMLYNPIWDCGWYFKINRYYYSNNTVGYKVGLISSDISPEYFK
jgi:hypothetical protein